MKIIFNKFLLFILIIIFSDFSDIKNIYANEKNLNSKNSLISSRDAQNSIFVNSEYILGPGDVININFEGLPEFSNRYLIGPGGFLYLPEINAVYAEGLTLTELKTLLQKKYLRFIKDPDMSFFVTTYRPVKIMVSGEVSRPGFYMLTGGNQVKTNNISRSGVFGNDKIVFQNNDSSSYIGQTLTPNPEKASNFPTLFDAIKIAQGITPYSDISKVTVIRKNTKTNGGGKINLDINFLSLFTENDHSQNIRIFDGDTIKVSKSNKSISEQIGTVSSSNLNPDFINVYISGNVPRQGFIQVPKGAGIMQAISIAGGPRLFSGKIKFLRFLDDGSLDKRSIRYNPKNKISSYKNPLLLNNDVLHVDISAIGKTTAFLKEISGPVVTSFTLINLF